METTGVYITAAHIKSMTKEEQAFLFGLLTGNPAPVPKPSISPPAAAGAALGQEDEHFAELSPGQARDFYNGCGVKTKTAIATIAASPSRNFQVADVARAIGVKPSELRGVWGGLTRRLQTVTGDGEAYLIDWNRGSPEYDRAGNYVDQVGEVTEMTYRSFRKVLKL